MILLLPFGIILGILVSYLLLRYFPKGVDIGFYIRRIDHEKIAENMSCCHHCCECENFYNEEDCPDFSLSKPCPNCEHKFSCSEFDLTELECPECGVRVAVISHEDSPSDWHYERYFDVMREIEESRGGGEGEGWKTGKPD